MKLGESNGKRMKNEETQVTNFIVNLWSLDLDGYNKLKMNLKPTLNCPSM
uniref:Uncharacterized protein n=2 Tax=Tetranychus urticae TaxID=32264 RepID=T1KLZ3_TETUR